MSMDKATLTEMARVAAEVQALAATVIAEIDQAGQWADEPLTGRFARIPWPKGKAPGGARPDGGKTTAALKRRSMDLTRLLAEMRRAD